ncbi:hypothetical protein ACEPAH_1446 [Sanghuangporus vaninii]
MPETSFVFPIRDLESARVRLMLFDPALHAQEFVNRSKAHPELFKYLPYGSFNTAEEFASTFYEKRVSEEPGNVLFAILDKTSEHRVSILGVPEKEKTRKDNLISMCADSNDSLRLAGVIGLLNTSVINQCTEIGYITIFPEYQRTHVTTNAVGLLLHYCLELPNSTKSKYGPGLGLRRVQWQTHGDNAASLRAAERMGFRREGLIRWQRALPEGKDGMTVSPEREALCKNPGRHTWILAVCWDDWELEGTRGFVQERMERI